MRLSIRHLNSLAERFFRLGSARKTNGKCGTAVLATYWTASLLLDQFMGSIRRLPGTDLERHSGVLHSLRPRVFDDYPSSLEARPTLFLTLAQQLGSRITLLNNFCPTVAKGLYWAAFQMMTDLCFDFTALTSH
ncbi:hypothetical protein EJ02DRAFT_449781 [Clathrospora elynae]|uniref:Uncharacterized protein n=1 Tax=Clathrospora elynae TaxID=706981 RepID=A0A6A5T4U5_9PLEO|nr:hypothetical protein EJ02DRAFT_449781 [Clathrospora elynae]